MAFSVFEVLFRLDVFSDETFCALKSQIEATTRFSFSLFLIFSLLFFLPPNMFPNFITVIFIIAIIISLLKMVSTCGVWTMIVSCFNMFLQWVERQCWPPFAQWVGALPLSWQDTGKPITTSFFGGFFNQAVYFGARVTRGFGSQDKMARKETKLSNDTK